ncbi:MAG: TetR/AcrR family transcriptional regulator, partial [Spirochaetaceae bacterium]|nr:TetR/AcrR family transcriptional regulator [Spirochaetaceae bacterium]
MTARMENTKEKILLAASRQLLSSPDITFSLSGIARALGISKAAIFRHFESKDKLFDAMRERFFDDLCGALHRAFPEGRNEPVDTAPFLRTVIRFLAERTESLGTLKTICSSPRDAEAKIAREFSRRGVRMAAPPSPDAKAPLVYVFITVVFYVFQYRDHGGASVVSPDAFADSLSAFLAGGWTAITELSEEEKAFCDSRCKIDSAELPEEDRFFSALMSVVFKHGFLGITIERVAGELGMAKSSLYAFFENKETLVRDLIKKEISNLTAVISEKLRDVTTLSGAVYVYMHLIYRYLLLRPEIIPVIVWHFAQGGAPEDLYRDVTLQ